MSSTNKLPHGISTGQQHFPYKLHQMLDYTQNSPNTSIQNCIQWNIDGKSFTIYNKEIFMNDVVTLFSKQTKFRSFVSIVWCIVLYFLMARPAMFGDVQRGCIIFAIHHQPDYSTPPFSISYPINTLSYTLSYTPIPKLSIRLLSKTDEATKSMGFLNVPTKRMVTSLLY